MKTLKFKCTLLSDVILNQKSASEGANETLDFIPGSCFLGIAAAKYDEFEKDGKALEIFHSGKVRFGDANPSKELTRGLKIPASLFYPKLKKILDNEIYVHHNIPEENFENLKQKQLKQCRDGFYIFDKNNAHKVETETSFAIKSAYDRENRCSKDEQMFGYESLQDGVELYFEVEIDNDNLEEDIKSALIGKKRVGRSRSAQYGLVQIEEFKYNDTESCESKSDIVEIYADGRLIFLDEYGIPTFKPTPKQLGLPENATILWEKSQIRTFQYAPWNYKRQSFDTDRCGIEKGSVFIVDVSKCNDSPILKSQYIGSYKNEGFGKVIYNPDFLKSDNEGKSLIKFFNAKKAEKAEKKIDKEVENLEKGTTLTKFLAKKKRQNKSEQNSYENVNKWVKENAQLFIGKEKFASQWSAIRGIAMSTRDDNKIIENVKKYIGHGIKSPDWEGKRKDILDNFMEVNKNNIREALVNLSAEMAKKCSRKEEK